MSIEVVNRCTPLHMTVSDVTAQVKVHPAPVDCPERATQKLTTTARSMARHGSPIILAALALSIAPQAVFAQDIVIVQSRSDLTKRRITGTVLDYTGQQLVLKHPSGREEKLPPSRIVEIQGDWAKSHHEANARFAERDYERAIDQYREALRVEERRWVQRRILAQLAWCYRYLDRPASAVQAFLPLYQDDPKTPYFNAIPLTWTARETDRGLQSQATRWRESNNSAAQLIGASWSLSSSERAAAMKALRRLAADPDPRIVFLAEAQLWRTEVATANQQTIDRWQQRIEKMPATIRGGPYFVIGQAFARQDEHETAALVFMKTVILHEKARDLAPHALLAAGRELEKIDQPTQAAGLYREILVDYATSTIAADAESRLKDLVEQ